MRFSPYTIILVIVLVAIGGGCQLLPEFFAPGKKPPNNDEPFAFASLPSDRNTITVEVMTIRVPYEQRHLLENLWNETDEQVVNAELRRRLGENGLRFGVQGAAMPPALARLLPNPRIQNIRIGAPEEQNPNGFDSPFEIRKSADEFDKEPMATRQNITFLANNRAELKPREEVVKELNLFEYDKFGSPICETYKDVHGRFILTGNSQSDGSVTFEILPELEYGEQKMVLWAENGEYHRNFLRPQRIFDQLKVSHRIFPGQWLIIGPSSENAIGLGKYFFTRDMGETEQKVVIIRLANSHGDGFFREETAKSTSGGAVTAR